ncbi:MAG: hypothetical protein SNJ76_01845 [Fimbriimonadaceae bacterium]
MDEHIDGVGDTLLGPVRRLVRNAKGRAALALLLVALIGAAGLFLVSRSGPSDQELIDRALADAIKAGREGRPGSVLELLSNEFRLNEQQIGSRSQVARAIRDYRPDVAVANTTAVISGDGAVIESPVTLRTQPPIPLSFEIPMVRMEFQRESATRWLVLPDKRWRLSRVTIPDDVFNQISGSPF